MTKLSVCVVLLMIAASYHSFAHIIDPETGFDFQYKAELAKVAPVVDGVFDDPAWTEASEGKLDQEIMEGRRWQESDDFKGGFAAVWLNGFLYLAIQLTDDQVETHHEKLSRQDHLVVHLDIDHTGHKSELYRHIIPVGKDGSGSNFPRLMVAWGSDGQSCEISVNLGYTPRRDEAIGFAIYYNDVDAGRLNHKIGWGPVGHTESDDSLADLVFTARLRRNENQEAVPWGRIKSLY